MKMRSETNDVSKAGKLWRLLMLLLSGLEAHHRVLSDKLQ